jgi:hypothetical protein
MPVTIPLTITDPPAPPAGYTLCAFEVRSMTYGGDFEPVAIFPGTKAGFEEAARILICAIASAMKNVGVGLRLAAVAWFAEQPLDECQDGRERLVSVYDGTTWTWSEWKPETRLGAHRVDPNVNALPRGEEPVEMRSKGHFRKVF